MPFRLFRRLVVVLAAIAVLPLAAQAQEIRNACERAARERGYRVVEFSRPRELYSGEKLSGYSMQLRLKRDAEAAQAGCVYRLATGVASLVRIERDRGDEADRRPPSARETQAICNRAVERRDFRILRVRGSRDQTDDRWKVIGRIHVFLAERDRREWRVECNYNFRSGRTEVEYFRP
jgi:hypothetical protein